MTDAIDPDDPAFVYDEFAFLSENCSEFGLDPAAADAQVVRKTGPGGLSSLEWGAGPARLVLLHGSAQNAHTWDTVALALRPTSLLAIDLPGHGCSEWRDDGRYDPHTNADQVIEFMDGATGGSVVLVGMSLGGLTAVRVAALRPDLVRRLVVIDITPGVTRDKAKEIHDFIAGPQTFAGFAAIMARTQDFNPTRSAASLRRGILHNAHRTSSGEWEWNYDRRPPLSDALPAQLDLWGDVQRTSMPYLLLRGGDSPVVDEDDVAELVTRRPDVRVITVDAAGHSIQGDQPMELARLLRLELDAD